MGPDASTLIDELQTRVPEWMKECKIDGFSVAVAAETGVLKSNHLPKRA